MYASKTRDETQFNSLKGHAIGIKPEPQNCKF